MYELLDKLSQINYEELDIDDFLDQRDSDPFDSEWVRIYQALEELKKGKMEKVEDLLGRPYFLAGEILHGRGLGHRMLLPTTNMIPDPDKLMPPNGVYVTVSHFENQVYGGITNIGCKPTVGGESFIGVETYLFDCNQDLYGKPCKVEFLHYLRPEHKFPSLEALKTQLLKDAQQGKDFMDKNQNIIYS